MPDPYYTELPEGSPTEHPFTPEILDKTVIAIPLLKTLRSEQETRRSEQANRARKEELQQKRRLTKPERAELTALVSAGEEALVPNVYDVIIDLNLMYPGGRQAARERVRQILARIAAENAHLQSATPWINEDKSQFSHQYLFGRLQGDEIRSLVKYDSDRAPVSNEPGEQVSATSAAPQAIYRIWPDFKVRSLITKSVSTVKADAARASFSAYGKEVLWAVLDSGIDARHPHFALHDNLSLPAHIEHKDFTGSGTPTVDAFGHGTHVAGIIAGEQSASHTMMTKKFLSDETPSSVPPPAPAMTERTKKTSSVEADEESPSPPGSVESTTSGHANSIRAYARHRDENGDISYETVDISSICGMAPQCKLLSLKVLDANGDGMASSLIAAIEYIQEVNGYGRRLHIHGVNMSVGYDFEPEWFACGQSPLCVEVDRLVRSGVVVVVAAGNTGYGWTQTAFRGTVSAGLNLTINDPGNAELAITVGSTHRDMPHIYGVSYFSSKGPTGDGRSKPDLVAPGEKILSCAAGRRLQEFQDKKLDCEYLEESGTSMAAPHVSGVIAAFLSVRAEFIGQPEKVKQIFLSTATDLKRERHFQGAGLVDLMRAIQSV